MTTENLVNIQTIEMDMRGVRLRAREAGHGPLILFMHGITANAAIWDPILTDLADRFHVVSLDQRGHGHSDHPENGYSGADFSEDARSAVDQLGQDGAVLVGHSLGARNALVAAAAGDSRIKGSVAVEFCPFIETEALVHMEDRVNGGSQVFTSQEALHDYLKRRYPLLPEDALSRRIEFGYEQTDDGIVPLATPGPMRRAGAGLRENIDDSVRHIRIPALMIRGGISNFVSADAFQRTQQLRPDLDYLVIPGTDHHVPEEKPHEVSRAIASFIDSKHLFA